MINEFLPLKKKPPTNKVAVLELAVEMNRNGLSYKDFREQHNNAYGHAIDKGFLDEVRKIFGVYKRKWNLNTALDEADRFDNLQDFILSDRSKDSAYSWLMKNWEMQLLNDFYKEKAQGRRLYPDI